MGNELSKEQEAEEKARTNTRMDAYMAEAIPNERQRFTAMVESRDAHRAKEKTGKLQREAAAGGTKPTGPQLAQSPEGDATGAQDPRSPTSLNGDGMDIDKVQDVPSLAEEGEIEEDAFSAWHPRKEPLTKDLGVSRDNDLDTLQQMSGPATDVRSKQQSTGPSLAKPTSGTPNARISKPVAPPTMDTNVISDQGSKPTSATSGASTSAAGPAKRPKPNAFVDKRRGSVQKAPKRTSAASTQSPRGSSTSKVADRESPSHAVINERPNERPRAWYKKLKQTGTRNPDEGNASVLLDGVKADIKACKGSVGTDAHEIFQSLRKGLHTLAFEKVSGQLLRNTRTLHNEYGLPQIFDNAYSDGVSFPWDIKADAEELYNKWSQQVFETDLLRGIIRGRPKKVSGGDDRGVDSIDPEYKGRASAKFHGNGLLLNGQWWPTQLAAVRDGGHGATIAGIFGATGHGAFSCIMSGGHQYPDKDHGEWVLYCGTDSDNGGITEPTQRMLESEKSGKPVRLIRSHNLMSDFAPEIGFRYDGLYKVVSHKNLDEDEDEGIPTRQRHQFRLERLPDQAPMRGTEPEKRPTAQEIEAHKKDKRLRGY